MERASAAIAAAGGPGDAPRIEGPQRGNAVLVHGASLSMRGVAVTGRGGEYTAAVYCDSKGRAELAGCALSSPEGIGLKVVGGATAEVQGGTIADCKDGVFCYQPGSKATVRPPARAPPRPRAKCLARWRLFSLACRSFFRPFFGSPEPPRREG